MKKERRIYGIAKWIDKLPSNHFIMMNYEWIELSYYLYVIISCFKTPKIKLQFLDSNLYSKPMSFSHQISAFI